MLAVVAEADRLAVLQVDQHVGAHVLLEDAVERAVVEDVAVLVHLDEGGALVLVRPPEHLHHVLAVHVVGAGDERRPRRRAPPTTGLNGWSIEPNGVDFVTLPTSDVGEYWPFVNP